MAHKYRSSIKKTIKQAEKCQQNLVFIRVIMIHDGDDNVIKVHFLPKF